MMKTAFLETANSIRDQLTDWRRQFHACPEIGLECYKTAAIVGEELKKLGIVTRTGIAKSGLSGIIKGKTPGPVVALRVDMDALPIEERTNLSFSSTSKGLMHACGHDGHTAIGLGVAALLSEMRDQFPGTVKIIFQPGEEHPGGAGIMIAEGVLENPEVDAIVGCHIHPVVPSGHIGVCSGTVTAGCAEIRICIQGKGGHAAKPHECRDPITAAGHLIAALQTIVSRRIDPIDPAVITIGEIKGGSGHNIIPESVVLKGTMRFISEAGKTAILEGIQDILAGIDSTFGVKTLLDISSEEPPMKVSDELTTVAIKAAQEILPADKVSRITSPSMGSEDFARFTEKVPAAYFRIGSFDQSRGYTHGLHTAEFDFDEDILVTGTAYAACLVCKLLTGLHP